MTAVASMEIQYVTPDGTLTYDGMTLFEDLFADVQSAAAAGSIDALTDVTITSATNGQVLRYNGTVWENGAAIALQTAKTATGTAVDFTGVPSWVNRITVTGSGISTNGTSSLIIRVGDGAIVSTGYLGAVTQIAGATPASGTSSSGCGIMQSNAAANIFRFKCTIDRHSGNTWVFDGGGALSNAATTMKFSSEVTLSGALDRVRITTVGGVDTFDAGTFNISWE